MIPVPAHSDTERSTAERLRPARDVSPAPPRTAPWVGAEPPKALVLLGAAGSMAVLAVLEVLVVGHIGLLVGLGFVVVCIAAALVVRAEDLFTAGVLPPLLMLGLLLAVSLLHPAGIAVRALDHGAGTLQVLIAGFVAQAGALVVAHMLALVLVGLRVRAVHVRHASR